MDGEPGNSSYGLRAERQRGLMTIQLDGWRCVVRRSGFLQVLVTVALVALFGSVVFAASGEPGANASQAKNVILCIGDGMGFGALQVSRNALLGPDGRFPFETFPNVAIVTTHSLNNTVTDSAAAATAIATGHKTNNGIISVLPDGTVVPTILEAMRAAGKATGLVVTNTIYDATPAAFGAHWGTRGGSQEIAAQLFDSGIDVLLGGGRDQYLPSGKGDGKRKDGRDIMAEAAAKGYAVVTTKDELSAVPAGGGAKVLGLFHPSYMNYQKDRVYLGTQEPSLADMTAKALEVLKTASDGFFLMIEGSRIDHAAHAGDVPGVVAEIADFAKAVELVHEFAKESGDTLVIVTADHDTMGFSATEPFDYESLGTIKVSPEFMALKLETGANGKFSPESIARVFEEFAGIKDLSDDEIQLVQSMSGRASYQVGYAIGAVIAARLNTGIVSPQVQLKSETGGHTGNPVPLYAFGPGAGAFSGVIDNTEIAGKVAAAAGVEFPGTVGK